MFLKELTYIEPDCAKGTVHALLEYEIGMGTDDETGVNTTLHVWLITLCGIKEQERELPPDQLHEKFNTGGTGGRVTCQKCRKRLERIKELADDLLGSADST